LKFFLDLLRTAWLTLPSYGPIVAIRKIVVKSLWSRVDKTNTLLDPENDSHDATCTHRANNLTMLKRVPSKTTWRTSLWNMRN